LLATKGQGAQKKPNAEQIFPEQQKEANNTAQTKKKKPTQTKNKTMAKRLQKELMEFQAEPKDWCRAELAKEDNLFVWKAEITGPVILLVSFFFSFLSLFSPFLLLAHLLAPAGKISIREGHFQTGN
jgi:hypothetical protein